MPLFDDTMTSSLIAGSPYGYSGTRIDRLGTTEVTLVAIAADASGSVHAFSKEIDRTIRSTLDACRQAPRADNLMVRITSFDGNVTELCGFTPLHAVRPPTLACGGSTALYDAAHNAVSSVTAYGRDLVDNGLCANAIVFVITDGDDNTSTMTAASVRAAIAAAVADEHVESVLTVLVGVNVQGSLGQRLLDFSAQVGFDHYLELADADASTLARLADFLSRSITSQSQVLGSGGPSTVLTF